MRLGGNLGGGGLGRASWRFSEFIGWPPRLSVSRQKRVSSSPPSPDLMTPPHLTPVAASAWSCGLLPRRLQSSLLPPPSTHVTWSPRLATFPTESTHARLSFSPLVYFQPGPDWVHILCVCVCFPREGQTVNSHHLLPSCNPSKPGNRWNPDERMKNLH